MRGQPGDHHGAPAAPAAGLHDRAPADGHVPRHQPPVSQVPPPLPPQRLRHQTLPADLPELLQRRDRRVPGLQPLLRPERLQVQHQLIRRQEVSQDVRAVQINKSLLHAMLSRRYYTTYIRFTRAPLGGKIKLASSQVHTNGTSTNALWSGSNDVLPHPLPHSRSPDQIFHVVVTRLN